jgi:hypothetical protein
MKKLSLIAANIALTVVILTRVIDANGAQVPDSELDQLVELEENITYLSMYLCQEHCIDCGYDEDSFKDDEHEIDELVK